MKRKADGISIIPALAAKHGPKESSDDRMPGVRNRRGER